MFNCTRRGKQSKAQLAFVLSTVVVHVAVTPATFAQTGSPIDTNLIRSYTRFLSDDSLAGRGTGTAGAATAARYIGTKCEALGLSPLADNFMIPVRLMESVVDTTTSWIDVRSETGGPPVRFRSPADFIPGLGRFPTETTRHGPIVYIGTADSIDRSTTTAPTDDAIAVTLGVPRSSEVQQLARRGFAAVIHIAPNRRTYDLIARSRGPSRWAHADEDVHSSLLPPIPTIIAGARLARALVNRATLDQASGTVELRLYTMVEQTVVHNVACVHRSDRPGAKVVALSAHLDHLGISTPDATGDSIYNGFSDNAAGVAMLLAIGRAVTESKWDHDIALLFFNAEERGLLGSDVFVHNPPVPLSRFAAVINLDAGAPPGAPTTWRIAGGHSDLGRLAVDAAEGLGWTATATRATPNTDYFPFVRLGVPAIFVVPGTGPYAGLTQTQSDRLKKRWDAYHQANDHWHADFPFSGLQRYAEYALAIVRAVAGESHPTR